MSDMHHRRAGYPFGTLVDFASDGAGLPIFCLSPLAIHARNIIEDSRCSLVVQMPGWTGLANARVTIFGDVYQLPQEMQVGQLLPVRLRILASAARQPV
jgi:putative heme iron utilization protein